MGSKHDEVRSVELDMWERRQIAMWAEEALNATHLFSDDLRQAAGGKLATFEADQIKEWLIDLLAKLQAANND